METNLIKIIVPHNFEIKSFDNIITKDNIENVLSNEDDIIVFGLNDYQLYILERIWKGKNQKLIEIMYYPKIYSDLSYSIINIEWKSINLWGDTNYQLGEDMSKEIIQKANLVSGDTLIIVPTQKMKEELQEKLSATIITQKEELNRIFDVVIDTLQDFDDEYKYITKEKQDGNKRYGYTYYQLGTQILKSEEIFHPDSKELLKNLSMMQYFPDEYLELKESGYIRDNKITDLGKFYLDSELGSELSIIFYELQNKSKLDLLILLLLDNYKDNYFNIPLDTDQRLFVYKNYFNKYLGITHYDTLVNIALDWPDEDVFEWAKKNNFNPNTMKLINDKYKNMLNKFTFNDNQTDELIKLLKKYYPQVNLKENNLYIDTDIPNRIVLDELDNLTIFLQSGQFIKIAI